MTRRDLTAAIGLALCAAGIVYGLAQITWAAVVDADPGSVRGRASRGAQARTRQAAPRPCVGRVEGAPR